MVRMRSVSKDQSRISFFVKLRSKSVRIWVFRWVFATILAVSASIALNRLQLTSQLANYFDGKTRLEQLKLTNEELRKEVALLEKELAEVSNPDWVEKQARERGMVRLGEQVFRVSEGSAESFPPEPSQVDSSKAQEGRLP